MRLRLIVIALFICPFLNAQFCPNGATWHHEWVTITPITGYLEMKYTHDTIINSTSCKVLNKKLYGYNYQSQSYFNQDIGDEFVYESGSVIYVYDTVDLDFDTLVNYSAAIGDSWAMPKRSVANFCEIQSKVIVLDTGSRIINGLTLKWSYVLNEYDPQGMNMNYTDTIFEKIGPTQWYFLPYPYCEQSLDFDNGGKLRCYSDSLFPTYNQYGANCDYILSINEIHQSIGFSINPNPTQDVLTIQLDKASTKNTFAKIYASDGRLLFIENLEAGNTTHHLFLQSLESGFYFIEIGNNETSSALRFIKMKD